ncbi:MAG: PilZ domain-containing protein [Polyangiaceae bacterium]|nr:PilZ domain-containing protein [Polyangiaceae bacterium]
MERRNATRHDLWIPVTVDGLREGIAVTHNASENGLLIVAASQAKIGERMTITLRNVPGLKPNPLTISGRVVRSGPNSDDPEGMWPFAMAVELDTNLPDLLTLVQSVTAASGEST